DHWLENWPGKLNAKDLAYYRIVFAAYILLFALPNWSWITDIPTSWFAPPPGPMAFFQATPPLWLLHTGTILVALLAGALLVGYRTQFVSYAIAAFWLIGNGFAYSWGKIDH